MNVEYTGRHYEISPSIRREVEAFARRLSRAPKS
jgi:ribosome-associated translation inhibitor RaiA